MERFRFLDPSGALGFCEDMDTAADDDWGDWTQERGSREPLNTQAYVNTQSTGQKLKRKPAQKPREIRPKPATTPNLNPAKIVCRKERVHN